MLNHLRRLTQIAAEDMEKEGAFKHCGVWSFLASGLWKVDCEFALYEYGRSRPSIVGRDPLIHFVGRPVAGADEAMR